jgi:hypothetical protein
MFPPAAIPAASIPSTGTNAIVVGTLGLILGASLLMFWLLSERSVARRQWVAMLDWGREQGFRLRPCPDGPPEPLAELKSRGIGVVTCLAAKTSMLMQLEEPARSVAPIPRPSGSPTRWNLLVRQMEGAWPPTGLRPTHTSRTALDLFSLQSYPLLGPTDRFVVYGTDSTAAKALSRSAARGLLPPDVGLLIAGPHLVLDFSARPFDEIEFNRMMVVADQLLKHLPVQR